jgi:hypothetical protein
VYWSGIRIKIIPLIFIKIFLHICTYFQYLYSIFQVLRHEEFIEVCLTQHNIFLKSFSLKGCKATCNGPYDNMWSKTMVGYGPEDGHFVLELTYNYTGKAWETDWSYR